MHVTIMALIDMKERGNPPESMRGLAAIMTVTVAALTLAVVTLRRKQSGYVTSSSVAE
jgi:hypothetical protein